MDLNEPDGLMSRNESFQNGSAGRPYRVASTMDANSASYNDEVGKNFTPQSVLNSTVQSGNGMSSNDYSSRTLSNGSLLPTGNGESADTRTGIAKLLLDGQRLAGIL